MSNLLDGIKNIIFDFGGVILNLDFNKSFEAFALLGVGNFQEMYSMSQQSDLFIHLETGQISNEDFLTEIKKELNPGTSNFEIIEAWSAMLRDLPAQRIVLLKYLKQKYRTFMLSNTNAIHYQRFLFDLQEKHGCKDFDDLFEKAYFSHTMGMKKPDLRVFQTLLNERELIPSETLFIDDSEVNTKGAEALGIKTLLLPPNQEIVDIFKEALPH